MGEEGGSRGRGVISLQYNDDLILRTVIFFVIRRMYNKQNNNKALALHSRAKRHTKTEKQGNNKEWDKAEGKERVSQNRHTKQKNTVNRYSQLYTQYNKN